MPAPYLRRALRLAVGVFSAAVAAPAPSATPAYAAPATAPPEVAVYAAASLEEALGAIGPICDARAGSRTVFSFGSSNELARQILAADKADLFLSADEGWMDRVAEAGLVDATTRRPLLSNRLVVVVPAAATPAISGAADLGGAAVRRLSLANPEAVPAGKYARAWLQSAGLWEKVRDKVVPANDVRAALAAVEAGATDAGVVYRTDAAIARKVTIAYTVPENEGPKIIYPVAAMQNRPRRDLARRLIECYAGREARGIFERHGFIPLDR